MGIKISSYIRKVNSTSSAVAGLLLITMVVNAQSTGQSKVEVFSSVCRNKISTVDGSPFVTAKFAPIRKLRQGELPQDGTWSYTFITDEQQYPNNEYVLNNDTDNKIQFVSILRPPKSDAELPPYLWHVISVPGEFLGNQENRVTGFVARHKDFLDKEETAWQADEYLKLIESTVQIEDNQTVLAYVKTERLGEDIVRGITQIWKNTFKQAMKQLVIASYSSENPDYYTHTFYYQDVPQEAVIINKTTGDRRNSSRRVRKPGIVFGFVLDDAGNCLAWNKLPLR